MRTRRLFRMSLQFKVAAVLLTVLVCAAAVAGLFSMRWIGGWLNVTTTLEAEKMVETLAAISSEALENKDYATLERISERTLNYGGIMAISLLYEDGTSAVSLTSNKAHVDMLPLEPESVALAYEHHLGPRRLLIARPVISTRNGMKVVGAIRLAIDTTSTARMLRKASIMTWSLVGLVVLCMFPLANLLLQKIIIRPIHRLAGVTRRLAAGDYSARAPSLTANDDISVLAESFNLMAERIETQHQMLVVANENLEGKVKRRTGQLDRANDRLRSQMDEHRKFLRAVSHDLNAPLRNIGGIADLTIMKWSKELPDEVIERLSRIRANVTKESELINDLLELSRLGVAPVRPEAIDIGETLTALKADFEYDLKRKNMSITIADDMPVIIADANHMRKLFQNLIDNSVKYMPENRNDGQIDISWSMNEDEYTFSVSDNGNGIDEKDREKIFTVFRRGSYTGNEPGKGVGLAGVAAIAARYEGGVSVDGKPGKGVTFHVSMSRSVIDPTRQEIPKGGKADTNASEADREIITSGSGC